MPTDGGGGREIAGKQKKRTLKRDKEKGRCWAGQGRRRKTIGRRRAMYTGDRK